MRYLDIGKGFPLLLGHSYLFDGSMWTPQLAALTQKYRVIVPDLWGHGASPAMGKDYASLTAVARDHLNLMDKLGIKEFGIIGLSVGGMWGAELAASFPERVSLVVLLDTWLGEETAAEKQRYFALLDEVEKAGALAPPILDYVARQFYSPQASETLLQPLRAHLANLSAEVLRESIVPLGRLIFGRPDKLALLKKIRAPALVITGEDDQPRPPAEGEIMAGILGCQHIVIPGAGHISNQEQPAAVTQALLDFLAAQPHLA